MRLPIIIAITCLQTTAIAAELKLDHHGRWVTAALLTETLFQESATVTQLKVDAPKTMPGQLAFLHDLSSKIDYRPTIRPTVPELKEKAQLSAMAALPAWDQWSYLSQSSSKLIPLCRSTASSPRCQAFNALQTDSAAEISAIKSLNTLAREKPNDYSDAHLRAYHSLLLLRQRNYPESLRVMFDLQAEDPKFKLIYNKIQRIYSLNQKAEGDVALRQSL